MKLSAEMERSGGGTEERWNGAQVEEMSGRTERRWDRGQMGQSTCGTERRRNRQQAGQRTDRKGEIWNTNAYMRKGRRDVELHLFWKIGYCNVEYEKYS